MFELYTHVTQSWFECIENNFCYLYGREWQGNKSFSSRLERLESYTGPSTLWGKVGYNCYYNFQAVDWLQASTLWGTLLENKPVCDCEGDRCDCCITPVSCQTSPIARSRQGLVVWITSLWGDLSPLMNRGSVWMWLLLFEAGPFMIVLTLELESSRIWVLWDVTCDWMTSFRAGKNRGIRQSLKWKSLPDVPQGNNWCSDLPWFV